MLKYTHGRWSWKFIDGNKPAIIIDDGNDDGKEINTLKLGDMVLIENAANMFELLNRFADLDAEKILNDKATQLAEFLRCMSNVKYLLERMNVAR